MIRISSDFLNYTSVIVTDLTFICDCYFTFLLLRQNIFLISYFYLVGLWLQIKAPSPLLQLPSFDIVSGVGIDSMHCVFLGMVKQLLGLWFDSKHSGQRWYCGNSVEKVDKRLLEIKPPSVITRVPRSIQHHLKFWKGN